MSTAALVVVLVFAFVVFMVVRSELRRSDAETRRANDCCCFRRRSDCPMHRDR